jgi:hypothetical protein
MQRALMMTIAAGVSVAGTACSTTGLSPREAAERTQPAYLYSLYDQLGPTSQSAGAAPAAKPLRLPATVAVVQVGEVAPPQVMIDALRKEPAVFARVEALPSMESYTAYRVHAQSNAGAQSGRPGLGTMRQLAADAGMDYLLLVGGTIDHGNTGTPLSLLDITIVGAFAVPSRETRGTARASAALIDVASGRAIANSSAEARRTTFVPAAQVDGEEEKLLERLRDEVVTKLGAQVLTDTKNRAAFGGGGGTGTLIPSQAPANGFAPQGGAYRTADGGPL